MEQIEYKDISLPEDVRQIISILMENGHEAYAVGGCVRDSLLGKEPKDWDITTSARPEEVKALFRRTIDTGIVHGTVTVMLGKVGYEVTTYRIDGEYEDGRHPRSVEFSDNLLEDLKRRDFTINAMAYNEQTGIVDEFGGIPDMKRQVIRCVRQAHERFTEDALRMMRAVRFSAQLGFSIEDRTFAAMCDLAPTIERISRERIQAEFSKTLLSPHPEYVEKYRECGILSHILPEVQEALRGEDGERVIRLLCLSQKSLPVRYAALLVTAGGEKTERTLRSLKLDNGTIRLAGKLVGAMRYEIPGNEYEMRVLLNETGADFWPMYSNFRKCHIEAFGIGAQALHAMERADGMYETVVRRGDCISLSQLVVGGNDLMALGVEQGKAVGETLGRILAKVLEDPARNNREWIEIFLTKYDKNGSI